MHLNMNNKPSPSPSVIKKLEVESFILILKVEVFWCKYHFVLHRVIEMKIKKIYNNRNE